MKIKLRKLIWGGIIGVLVVFLGTVAIYHWMDKQAEQSLFEKTDKIPYRAVTLVLGTNSKRKNGATNYYFKYRMDAAAALYHAGKTSHFLVSGDNSRKDYSEPAEMKTALIDRGVPADAITMDYAGFRTLDSVERCKAVFQQDSIIIVSQKFHNIRALFIAGEKDINAIAINAPTPAIYTKSKVRYREYLARVKAVLDLYILNKKPRFYGEPIDLSL